MKRPRIHREGRGLIVGTVLLLFMINVPIISRIGRSLSHWR